MSEVRFDGKVAIVTGAGGGLGRTHAILLASRGAKVVVNDLGGSADGTGAGSEMADAEVKEIKDAGGEAVANYAGVHVTEGAESMVKPAVDNFGGIDILINNAGILRDKSFMKMTEEDWDIIIAVHLKGTYNVTKAAFPLMREKGYGRIVNTTSAAGLFGNFGQVNYAAAKLGIVGLMNALKLEGKKYNVLVNTIAPLAGSRLTETVMPADLLAPLKPEYVSSLVAWLCSEECTVTGDIYSVGGGYVSRAAMVEAPGIFFDTKQDITIEQIKEKFEQIRSLEGAEAFEGAQEAMGKVMGRIMG